MFNKLSYQLINSLAVSQAVLCYIQNISKIITEKKAVVLVVTSNAVIHSWLNLFELILVNLGFSTLIFSTGFNRYAVVYSS